MLGASELQMKPRLERIPPKNMTLAQDARLRSKLVRGPKTTQHEAVLTQYQEKAITVKASIYA